MESRFVLGPSRLEGAELFAGQVILVPWLVKVSLTHLRSVIIAVDGLVVVEVFRLVSVVE